MSLLPMSINESVEGLLSHVHIITVMEFLMKSS